MTANAGSSPEITNPTVEGALRFLTGLLERGSFNNPYYRDRTVEVFRRLRKGSEPFADEPIAAYLSHHGVDAERAKEAESIARQVASGKGLRGAPEAVRPDVLERSRASGSGSADDE